MANSDTSRSSTLVKACRGEPTSYTPVWFMRQAGRYNPRHRELYEEHGVRGLTTNPELCADVTCLPVRDLGVDAAVMYADIILPLENMGIDFEYGAGDVGPILHNPVRSPSEAEALRLLHPEEGVPYVLETIRRVKQRLPADVPLIGFSGGPFTLAGYIIEGTASRTFPRTKSFMYRHPEAFEGLMETLSESIVTYLRAQVRAGVDVLQLFESWMGALGPRDYERFVHDHTKNIYSRLRSLEVPTIHFGTATGGILPYQAESGADVLGVDWRSSLSRVAREIGTDRPIMGNLDPAAVLGPLEVMERKTRRILKAGRRFPGHVFNLGHRVPGDATVASLKHLVEFVHETSRELRSET